MPMYRGTFEGVADVVEHCYLDRVTPIRLNLGPWELTVDEDHVAKHAVRRDLAAGDCPVVVARDVRDWNVTHNRRVGVLDREVAPWRAWVVAHPLRQVWLTKSAKYRVTSLILIRNWRRWD